jgi:hypothetical protein
MIQTSDITRPPRQWVEALQTIGAATVGSTLSKMGIRVVVPVKLAPELIKEASIHHEWEVFSKVRLMEGGDLRRYCPLSDAAHPEYEERLKAQASQSPRQK